MTRKKTVGKTTQALFQEDVDYTKPTTDRPFKWRLEDGNIIYLNLEQRQFLARDYYNESKRNEREKRCIVPSSRNGMNKRCRGKCFECKYYRYGKDTLGTISLDKLYELYEWEPIYQEESILDKMIYNEQRKALYEAIEQLKYASDVQIIKLVLDGVSERNIAKIVGMSQKGVNKRKVKIIEELKEIIKR